jgi:hypothetical protein
MIIWSGYGYLVFLIVFLCSLCTELISESLAGDEKYYQTNLIPLGCSLIISGILIKMLSDYLKRKANLAEKKIPSSRTKMAVKSHNLFFIPMAYWTYILYAIGTVTIGYQIMK